MTNEERIKYMRQVRSTPRRVKSDEEIKIHLMGRTAKNGECLEFTGYKDILGYGKMRLRGRQMLSHRASFILNTGEIPEGMLVCHTCDNPPCINPDHLFLGTNYDNTMDAVRKGRKFIPDTNSRVTYKKSKPKSNK